MFQFDQAEICDPLKPYLQAIFHYEDFVPDHSIERVVPTGHIFILFELDGFERYTYDENQNVKQKFCGAWISGIQRAPISISAHAHSQMFVMQFKALGAAPFLGLPVQQFTDQVVPGADVLDGSLLVLREALLNCQTVQARFELAQQWLSGRFDPQMAAPDDLLDVVTSLATQPGAEFAQATAQYPHSHKHLIDQCHKYLGVTPKIYQRILRFNEVFQYLQNHNAVSWAQVAAHCGYADQSHFIHEFKKFTGFNPAEFLRSDYDLEEANFFPLD